MASTPEGKVKAKCVEVLKSLRCWYFFPAQNGYGRAGIPDIVGCIKGRFFAIECKAGKGTTTALQDREIVAIQDAGGFAMVVNEDNVTSLRLFLERL